MKSRMLISRVCRSWLPSPEHLVRRCDEGRRHATQEASVSASTTMIRHATGHRRTSGLMPDPSGRYPEGEQRKQQCEGERVDEGC